MILHFGLSCLWMSIPILVPSQGSLKTLRILFQLCGGTWLAILFSLREWCFGWDGSIIHLKILGLSGYFERIKREGPKLPKVSIQFPDHHTCKGNGWHSHSCRLLEVSIWPYVLQNFWIPTLIPWNMWLTRLPGNIQIMHGWTPTTITNCIRAFTNVPAIAQFFHRAGLPIWFLQPWKTVPFHTMFWLSLLLLILRTLCVFLHMNPLSLWYSMATWTLKRNMMPSNPTHGNGSFLKIRSKTSHHQKIQSPKDM